MVCGLINFCYLCKYKPFEDPKILKLEVMNEATNFMLLYHLMMFTQWVPEAATRYAIGGSFIFFICANILVHFSLLVNDTAKMARVKITQYRKMKCCLKWPCKRLPIIMPHGEVVSKNLSMIAEEDEFESNFSEKDEITLRKEDRLSDSDWDSKLGASDKPGGYDLSAIRWTDLGRKYIA